MTTDPDNQPKEIYNEPGLEALSYRVARHDDSLERMSHLLHTQTTPGQKNGQGPLAPLTTSHGNDPAIALLDGWATVMEVLTFYQERIANEGFINTATERRSVLELSRTVGYELDPGVAASTYLAFTIDASDNVPEIITVPEGVRVESVPIADEQPQVFETIETLEMRGAWNVLKPHIPSLRVPQKISKDTVQVKISGIDTQLDEGDSLLIVEDRGGKSYESRYLTLKTVEPDDDERDYTVVSWDKGLGWEPRGPLQLFALRERTILFGSEAQNWNDLSLEEKRLYGHDTGGVFSYKDQKWQSISTGSLKNADVRALVREPKSQSLFVGTNYGIFRSPDDGENWVEINKGLIDINIYSLAINDKGYIFAGATGGNVFRSIDLGESWVEIGSGGVSIVIQYQVPNAQTIKEVALKISNTATNISNEADTIKGAATNISDETDTIKGAATNISDEADTIKGAATNISNEADTIKGAATNISNEADTIKKTADTISGAATNISGAATNISGATTNIKDAATNISGAATNISGAANTLPWNVGQNWQWEVKSTEYQETNLPNSIIRCIAVYDNIIYVGTEYGIYRSQDSGHTWVEINKGKTKAANLTGTIVYTIVKNNNSIFVGTDRGVFRSSKNGNTWEEWEEINDSGTPKKLADKTVYALLLYNNSNLLAGTNLGVFLSTNFSGIANNVSWIAKNNNIGTVPIIYALTSIGNKIYAGTSKGVFLTEDVAENWTEINTGLINKEIRSLLCYNNKLLAGSWFDRLHTKDWPGFDMAEDIDLNGIDDNIFPGSWVVLKNTVSNKAYKVEDVKTVLRNDFGENGKITRIHLETGVNLKAFEKNKYRETVVLCQSEALKLHEATISQTDLPVEGDKIELDKVVPGLKEGRKITISGKRMRAKIPPMGGVVRQSLLNDNAWANLQELWTPTDVNDLSIYKDGTRETLFAGTAQGVLSLDLGSQKWDVINQSLNKKIDALESYTDKENATLYILAGTESGISIRKLGNWTDFDKESLSYKVNCMQIYAEKDDRHLLAGTENGIWCINLDNQKDKWENITGNLEKQNVFSLATYMERGVRTIFVGAADGDIFSWKSNGQSWIKFDNCLPNKMDVKALTTYAWQGDRYLCAGTKSGLFRLKLGTNAWEVFDTDLPNKHIWTLNIYYDSGDISLLAGTDSGIFGRDLKDMTASWRKFSDSGDNVKQVTELKTYTYKDTRYILTAIARQHIFSRDRGGISWQKEGLTNTEVRSLKIHLLNSKKCLFAGTAEGIFYREMSDRTWKPFNDGLTNTDVNVLEIYSQNGSSYILAGTAANVCRRNLNGPDETWQELARGWTDRQVRALKFYQQGDGYYILAGTAEGVFYLNLTDDSASWTSLNDNNDGTADGLPVRDVRALDIYRQKDKYYVLVGTKSGVFKGLMSPDRKIEHWTPEDRKLTNKNVYSLALYTQNGETTLFAGTKGGNIYRRAISIQNGEWKQMRQALANDVRAIAISSQGQLFIGTANHCILKGKETVESKAILPGESLVIWQRRTLQAMPSQQVVHWTLMDKLGFKGEITTGPAEMVLEVATDEDKIVSEAASLGEITHGRQRTTIALETPLDNTFDRTTVTINGNVAPVTHGETILDEVLGSGDGSKQNHEFVLKNPPLTYIPANTPRGSKSTLTVRVDGLLWEEVPSLYHLKSPTRHYMTRIDDDGTTRIIFGDGYKGVRPPSGEENITATYRSGIGPEGEVAPNTITLVQSAPLGVVEVTNPQAATGAAPPETRDEARQNAGLKTRSWDRIISLRDYEHLIGGFSAIGKAQAIQLQTPQGGMVQVTLAGRNGTQITRDSNLYAQIKKAVEIARDPSLSWAGGPASKFSLDSYQPLLFNVEGKLWINRRYLVSAVMPEVKKTLKKAFAFERRAFAQNVTVAEVIQLIQSVKGVDGVDLDALYLDSYDPQLNQELQAKPATWDGLKVEPAQLLLLNPAAGSINLTGMQL
ncbi:MAG: hypothetical protein EBE86_025155 [Hormoscilla sp. GUM202]|nr:hypothetical protein [Hormoscilla sp. GUM202]